MTTTRHTTHLALAALAALAAGSAPAAARADDLEQQVKDPEFRAMFDRKVPLHPALTGYAGIGFGASVAGDGTYGLAGALRLDSNAVESVWFDGKFRLMPGAYQGDASVGWVLGNDRRFGYRTWEEKVGQDQLYDYYKVYGKKAFLREASVLSAGVKVYKVTPKGGSGEGQFALTAAYQHHDYSHFGDRNDWDVALLWNPSGGFGAVADVNYGLPIGNPRFTVGGQIGWLPLDSSKVRSPSYTEVKHQITLALEFGLNFGN